MNRLLERLAASKPAGVELQPIPWPHGLAPRPYIIHPRTTDPLPECDALVVTYTSAEGEALADVLTPGVEAQDYHRYTRNWHTFEKHLTGESPAHYSKCMAAYALGQIGSLRVLCVKSDLHVATDDSTLPVVALFEQMIGDCKPKLVVTTGTAGGIGSEVVEGDCNVASAVHWDCQKWLKDRTFAQQLFPCTFDASHLDFSKAEALMLANYPSLQPEASRPPVVRQGHDLCTDFFGWDNTAGTFGFRTFDPQALTSEMDDGAVALAIEDLGTGAPPWISVRSASDPQMPSAGTLEQQEEAASKIYLKFGYAAQVATLCAVWQILASL